MRCGLEFCTIVFVMNWGMDYWVSYIFYSLSSPKNQNPWRNTIANNRFDVTPTNSHNLKFLGSTATKDFELLLLGRIEWYPVFNRWPLPSLRTRRVKNLTQNTQLLPNVFQCFILKILIIVVLYSVFADLVTYCLLPSYSWYSLLCH